MRQPGMIGLYTDRMSHQIFVTDRAHRIAGRERTLTGDATSSARGRRALAIVERPRRVGRGSEDHYRALHPALGPSYGRLRSGIGLSVPRRVIAPHTIRQRGGRAVRASGATVLDLVQSVFMPSVYGTARPHVNTARRILVGTVAAFMVLVSATGTGFAGQQRYEARDGETVTSVASVFGVNPEAIRRSSYLPTGDALAGGQVIVIPEPGQLPSDAALMAAEREGTSPFVETAHWVASGDTLAAIGGAYGVAPEVIAEFNGIADPGNLPVGSRVLIPRVPAEPTGDGATAPVRAIPNVGTHVQEHRLSCEYAAAFIATSAFGNGVPESTFIAQVPAASNPHYGYRGNIDGVWGNTTDYGVYPEALVPVLSGAGFATEVMYTGGDIAPLKAHLDAGRPVLVWLGFWGDTRETLTDQDTYAVLAGMHVVTVYGYDDGGIHVSDPASGTYDFYSWDAFVGMWRVIDGMSLAVYPQ